MAGQPQDDMECTNDTDFDALLNDSQMDFDIDKTLNDKAQNNHLTKRNVKNLIRNVLINDDVVTMLRQTLNDDKDANCLYEPKLTRAKIKQLLQNYPSSIQQWSPFQQQSIISECRQLIEKEFNDDSEDEEYHPDKILDEEDFDDDDSKCAEINKSFDEIEVENSLDSTNAVGLNDMKDTIGMRTRSKYSLNDTPLEVIEQAFIPPDITEDMYDSVCENDEWMEFLSEFTKPLEPVQNDDQDDDPEYNVLCDDNFTNVVDKEEFRIDRSVKISRKEYNELMNELNDFTESFLEFNGPESQEPEITKNDNKNVAKNKDSIDSIPVYTSNCSDWKSFSNDKTTDSANCRKQTTFILQKNIVPPNIYEQLQNMATIVSLLKKNNDPSVAFDKTVEQPSSINQNNFKINKRNDGMAQKQIILLKHQMTQHVQLLTQSYLLCTMANKFKCETRKLKIMLERLQNVCKNKNYAPINIDTSLRFIQDWGESQIKTPDLYNMDHISLPPYVKHFMLFHNAPVFVYPSLLPSKTFYLNQTCRTNPLGKNEETVLVMKIYSTYKRLKNSPNTRAKYKTKCLSDLMPIIIKTVHKRWFSHRPLKYIKHYITRRRDQSKPSILRNYLVHGQMENIVHKIFVKQLLERKCLHEKDIKEFPSSWKPLVLQFTKENTS